MTNEVIRISKIDIDEFRGFHNASIRFSKLITIVIGQNGTSKSTLLGMLAQPFSFGKRTAEKDQSVYFSNYHGLALHEYKDISGRKFEYDCDQVFRLSKEHDKPENGYLYSIYIEGIDFRKNEDSPLKSKKLLTIGKARPRTHDIRFVTGPGAKDTISHNKGEGNFPHPVIYLSLGRLLPLAEIKKCDIDTQASELSEDEKEWYIQAYKRVLGIVDENPFPTIMNTKEKKRSVVPSDSYYDGESCSAGQDNIGRVLTALLSFRRLKQQLGGRYRGGLLLIDEIDATLHPASQQKLMEVIVDQSDELQLQVVLTSHSLFLIEKCSQSKLKKKVGLVQLTKAYGKLEIRDDATYKDMILDLENAVGFNEQKVRSNQRRVSVLVEDKVAVLYLKYLCRKKSGLLSKVKIVNLVLGTKHITKCENVSGRYLEIIANNAVKIPEFENVIYIPDGDMEWVKDSHNSNVLALPGKGPLEVLLFKLLKSLSKGDSFWRKCRAVNYSKQAVFNDFNGDLNPQLKEIKSWFDKHQKCWGRGCEIALDRLYEEMADEFDEFCFKFEQMVRRVLGG